MIRRRLAWALLLIAAITAFSPLALPQSRRVLALHDERLPLDFPHQQHGTLRCLDCHHTITDTRISKTTPCIACHRSRQVDLKLSVEPRFHSFCRDCHAEKARLGLPHGPVRDCAGCHHHPRLQ